MSLLTSLTSGITTNFDPAQVIIPPSDGEWKTNQSILTITATDSMLLGTYNLTVYADFGAVTNQVNITLTITERENGYTPVGGYSVDTSPSHATENTLIISVLSAPDMISLHVSRRKRRRCMVPEDYRR